MHYKLESFLKAQHSYKANTPIQAYMRKHLLTMLQATKHNEYPYVFEFGCGQCELTTMLTNNIVYENYICNDIHEYDNMQLPARAKFICFDMHNLAYTTIFKQHFHLIASNACLQWLPFYETLTHLAQILYNSGLLLIGTFGVDNYREIKEITGIGLPYIQSEAMKEHIKHSFECLAWHEEHIVLEFDSALAVFRHLQQSGVNAMQSCYLRKSWLQRYTQQYANTLTYHIICFLARKH